jgi:uncharacterized membrane protein YraQ (UPF0718 family)
MTMNLVLLPMSTAAAVMLPSVVEDPIAKLVAAGLSIAVTIGVLVKLVWELQKEKRDLLEKAQAEKMALLAEEREQKAKLAESLEKSRQDLVALHRETITMGYKTASAAESASDAAKEVSQLVRDLRQARANEAPRFHGNMDGN